MTITEGWIEVEGWDFPEQMQDAYAEIRRIRRARDYLETAPIYIRLHFLSLRTRHCFKVQPNTAFKK